MPPYLMLARTGASQEPQKASGIYATGYESPPATGSESENSGPRETTKKIWLTTSAPMTGGREISTEEAVRAARKACAGMPEIEDGAGVPADAPAGVDQEGGKYTITLLKTLDPSAPAGAYYAIVEMTKNGTPLSIETKVEETGY